MPWQWAPTMPCYFAPEVRDAKYDLPALLIAHFVCFPSQQNQLAYSCSLRTSPLAVCTMRTLAFSLIEEVLRLRKYCEFREFGLTHAGAVQRGRGWTTRPNKFGATLWTHSICNGAIDAP